MVMNYEEYKQKKRDYYHANKQKIRAYQNKQQKEAYQIKKLDPDYMKHKSEISLKCYYKVKNNTGLNVENVSSSTENSNN